MSEPTARTRHDEAMQICEAAIVARKRRQPVLEASLLHRALRLELKAAARAATMRTSFETIATLTRSAASMVERIAELRSPGRRH